MTRLVGYRLLLILAWAAGLTTGFALGVYVPLNLAVSRAMPVNVAVRLDRTSSDPVILDAGWGKRQAWGVPMFKDGASMTLGFDGPSAGDVELLAEARLEGAEDYLVLVRYNDVDLGRWLLSPKWSPWRRRFIIPEAVFNRRTDGLLSFQSLQGKEIRFGLETVSLRDATGLGVHKGFLDSCARERLAGWAIAQDTPVSVVATVDGKPVPAAFMNVYRPDLPAHGIPPDAGFELTMEKPLPPGTKVDVRLPNGHSLSGSPCQL